MSSVKSKPYTISSLGSTGYTISLDDELKIRAVYEDGKILNPTNSRWNTVVNADETKTIWNQLGNTSGLAVVTSPTDIVNTFYETELKKELNAATDPKSVGSSDNLFYRDGVVADVSRVRGTINPQQFASPNSVKYGRTETVASAGAPEVLAYPIDIDTGGIDADGKRRKGQDYIEFKKIKYARTSANMSRPEDLFKGEIKGKYGGTVILPMPKVSDSNGAEWGESDLNVFGVAAAEVFKGAVNIKSKAAASAILQGGTFSTLATNFNTLAQTIGGSGAVAGSIFSSRALKQIGITASPDELLARATGFIANPNAELLFQGPTLRDFGFQFLMIARSAKEGESIRKIIKWFKQGAAPKYNSQALLGTPDIFQLEYSTPLMNKFNQMALRTITVDYAPDGYWAAYDDSHPVAALMSLQFTELKPIYDRDQENDKDDVGY